MLSGMERHHDMARNGYLARKSPRSVIWHAGGIVTSTFQTNQVHCAAAVASDASKSDEARVVSLRSRSTRQPAHAFGFNAAFMHRLSTSHRLQAGDGATCLGVSCSFTNWRSWVAP
jgi:hypothetical protein